MTSSGPGLGAQPRDWVRRAIEVYGEDRIVDWCVDLLTGRTDAEAAFAGSARPELTWIGGAMAADLTARASADRSTHLYWVRVWACRAFLYVWRDDVTDALVEALRDDAWRVREGVARVAVARRLGAVVDQLLPMLDHDLPRVRLAAVRAIGVAGESEHASALAAARDDPDAAVRAAAELALDRMTERLDRTLPDLLAP